MNPRHALLKPTPRAPEPPRLRSEPTAAAGSARHERVQDWRSEIRDESESFEHWLAPLDGFGQPTLTAFSDGGFDHQQEPRETGSAPLPSANSEALCEALLARLEEHLATLDDGPIEAQLELPNLGRVSVRVIATGDRLEIALRFANDNAWEQCQAQQRSSAVWLGQQLGRPVSLSLHREVH